MAGCDLQGGVLFSDILESWKKEQEVYRKGLEALKRGEEETTYIAVHAEFEILRESETFDARYVSEIEEPDVGEHFAFVGVACHDAAEYVDLDFDVGRRVDQCYLHGRASALIDLDIHRGKPTGRKKTREIANAKSAPYQRSCTG